MTVRYLFSDCYWVLRREVKKFLQQKARIVMIVVQPLIWLVLMGNALAGLTGNPIAAKMLGTGNYLVFMTPGVMIMTAVFGGVFGGASVLWDRRTGMLNKMLAAPIHRASIPLGKLMSIGLQTMIQSLIIVVIAYILGVRFSTGIPGIFCMLIISAVFGMIMGCISLSLASKIKSIETLMAISNFLTMPLMFTSNAIYPVSAMPAWLRVIANINPLSHAVSVMRTIASQGWVWSDIWQPLTGLLVIFTIAVFIAVRLYARLGR